MFRARTRCPILNAAFTGASTRAAGALSGARGAGSRVGAGLAGSALPDASSSGVINSLRSSRFTSIRNHRS